MRLLLLGSAALLLSGCSFLGLGGATNNIPQLPQAGALGQVGDFGQFGSFGQFGPIANAGAFEQNPCLPQPVQFAQPVQFGCDAQSTYSVQQPQFVQATQYAEPQYVQPTQFVEPQYQYVEQQFVQPVAAAPTCHSGNCLSRWNLEGGIGAVFPAGRNILTSSRTNNVAGTDFNSVSFGDAFDTGIRAELGGSYALAPNTKVTLLGHYEKADSNGVQDLGTINGDPLTGALTDYEAYGVELGLRQYFAPRPIPVLKSFRPYVEGRIGVSHVDDIRLVGADLAGAPFNGGTIPLYEDSWVPTAAGLVGIETPVARYTTIGLETGLRYQGGLESDTSVLAAGTDIGGLNNNRGRYSIPLTLRGRYRF